MEKFNPVNEKKIKNEIKFTLRIPEELHEELATFATTKDMSMNNLILQSIRFALDNIE